MKIGIDIDDTITDSYEITFNYAQEFTINTLQKSGKIIESNNIDNHFYTRVLHNWKKEEEIRFWLNYYEKIITQVKPKTLALEYMQQLKKEGHELILITARFKIEWLDVEGLTKRWLDKYKIPYDKLIIDAENKGVVAKRERLDVFLDDSFKNCKSVSENGIKSYLMDSRVNRQFKDEKIERVYSWPHFYQELMK